MMDQKYPFFVVLLTHVGYTWRSAHPCILVIASNFSDADAYEVIDMFNRLHCKYIKRLFCYDKDKGERSVEGRHGLRVYTERPGPEHSISVVGG
jgi:hypothetical protein